jgi:hypothetical protein
MVYILAGTFSLRWYSCSTAVSLVYGRYVIMYLVLCEDRLEGFGCGRGKFIDLLLHREDKVLEFLFLLGTQLFPLYPVALIQHIIRDHLFIARHQLSNLLGIFLHVLHYFLYPTNCLLANDFLFFYFVIYLISSA